MTEQDFENLAAQEFLHVPPRFAVHIANVALLVEDEPSVATRIEEKLTEQQTLLGLYHGVPLSVRGDGYGIGGTLPDTITLYRKPILMEANERMHTNTKYTLQIATRVMIRETLWHELGHAFGLAEETINVRETQGTNHYPDKKH